MSTKIIKMACQGCGADLQVKEGIRFVTCNFCGSRLEVVQDQSVTHTRLLEDLADNLKVIELQNEIEKLDREWSVQREGFMVRGKNGHKSIPSAGGSIFGGVFAIGAGVVWMVITSSAGAPGFFPLFGLVFIVAGIAGMVSGSSKASGHDQAKAVYEKRRAELSAQLDAARR